MREPEAHQNAQLVLLVTFAVKDPHLLQFVQQVIIALKMLLMMNLLNVQKELIILMKEWQEKRIAHHVLQGNIVQEQVEVMYQEIVKRDTGVSIKQL